MKKEIAVIALDPFAGRAYADQIREVFGSAASVRNYSVMDKTAFRIAPCDLCMVSTDAFNAMNEPGRPPFRPEQRMEIQVTYRKEIIRRLNELPRGSRVLFVNVTETMAREAVAQLEQLGVPAENDVLTFSGKVCFRSYIAVLEDYFAKDNREISLFN